MTNSITILECFATLVGWRESAKAGSCYENLTTALKTSDSGQYINDVPGISLELINTMIASDENSVNDYLTNLHESQILELMNVWENMEKREVYTKSLLANNDLGVRVNDIRDTTVKLGRFVGWKIIPHESNSIRAEVLQLGGMFDTTQDDLEIYFYSSRQKEPIAIYTTDITVTNSQQWFTLEELVSGSGSAGSSDPITFICDYINKNSGHGQEYYIGYYEDDLTGNPIFTDFDCLGCAGKVKELDRFVTIFPIEVPSGNTYVSRELFDIDAVSETTQTFGLFMKVNVTCDASECICDNKKRFANALKKMIAKKIFWDCFNTNETNFIGASKKEDFRLMADKLEQELYGYVHEGRRIPGEIENITLDLSNLDTYCLGMRKRSLGVGAL